MPPRKPSTSKSRKPSISSGVSKVAKSPQGSHGRTLSWDNNAERTIKAYNEHHTQVQSPGPIIPVPETSGAMNSRNHYSHIGPRSHAASHYASPPSEPREQIGSLANYLSQPIPLHQPWCSTCTCQPSVVQLGENGRPCAAPTPFSLPPLDPPSHFIPRAQNASCSPVELEKEDHSEEGEDREQGSANDSCQSRDDASESDDADVQMAPDGSGNGSNSQGKTVLHLAVESGNVAVVKALLKRGVDVNTKDGFGHTALHTASKNGHSAIVELLLKADATMNARDQDERTPLQLAAIFGHQHVARLLLEAGSLLY